MKMASYLSLAARKNLSLQLVVRTLPRQFWKIDYARIHSLANVLLLAMLAHSLVP